MPRMVNEIHCNVLHYLSSTSDPAGFKPTQLTLSPEVGTTHC